MPFTTSDHAQAPPFERARSLLNKLPDELASDSTLESPEALQRAEEQAAIQLSRDMQTSKTAQEVGDQGVGLQEQEELGHMQLVLEEGLWIGDVYAAQDEKSLKEAGIVSFPVPCPAVLPPETDDRIRFTETTSSGS